MLYLDLSSTANQCVKIYTLATEGISCGFEECNQRSKVAIKSGIFSLKLIRLGLRMKLVVMYKLRGARVNSVLHVKHKPRDVLISHWHTSSGAVMYNATVQILYKHVTRPPVRTGAGREPSYSLSLTQETMFHLPNHVNPECHTLYSPRRLKEKCPDANTQAGEQMFVWLGRFKHILCAMNKQHHLFYLHRMVRRRNAYTVKCYKAGKKPILPRSKL